MDDLMKQEEQALPKNKVKLPGRKRRWPKVLLALILVAALAAWAVLPRLLGGGTDQTAAGYVTDTAQRRDLAVTVTGTATLEPADSYQVTTLLSGTILTAPFDQDGLVAEGDVLYTLDSSGARDSVSRAGISVEQARLGVQQAQEALDSYTITAPISGTVIEKNVKAGDKVDGIDSGTLAVLYDLSCLTLQMNVSELDIGKVREGQQVEITADALPGQTFRGVVDRVSINGATTNGFTTYPATIRVEEYGDLKPGMNVSAVILGDTVSGALTVPVSAVSRGNKVLAVPAGALGENGTLTDPAQLEERTVTLGVSDGAYIQITGGLEEGDTVAYLDTETAPAGG